jgi:hypothetical protein
MMETQVVPCGLRGGTVSNLLTHPDDVIADSRISELEKRAILADWASDARAVEDAPGWRQLDSGAVVCIDDVLNALRLLDNAGGRVFPAKRPPFARRRRAPVGNRTFANEPDDDTPPPCAAGASMPTRPIYTIATAVSLAEAA